MKNCAVFGFKIPSGTIANELIADKENHRYQVVTIGWEGNCSVPDCPLHFDSRNGKIWVQQNGTEWEVGEMHFAALGGRGTPGEVEVLFVSQPCTKPMLQEALSFAGSSK